MIGDEAPPRRSIVWRAAKQPGAPPGTVMHVGRRRLERVLIHTLDYGPDHLDEREDASLAECRELFAAQSVTWVDVVGLHDVDLLREIGDVLRLHPLMLEDIPSTRQRPKVEEYPDHLFVVLRMLQWPEGAPDIQDEQVSLVLGPHYVVSFQEQPGDVFEPVRERLRHGRGLLRSRGPDYLAYTLMDAVVDHYFGLLERLGAEVEELEDQVLLRPGADPIRRIHHARRQSALARRSIWPLREVLSTVYRGEHPLVSDETRLFVRDVYDHSVQVIDTLETVRELTASVMDLHMSTVSNRMNEVMKVLTIMASIFIPLSFLAGLYGMNFDVMPELHVPWGYPALLGVMAVLAGGMLWYFRRRGWL